MKQFSLGEYLKDPSRKVVMRDGRPVRIVCTDMKGGGDQPIVALFPSSHKYLGEIVSTFCANGEFTMGTESEYDLFFAPEKHEGWVNIYNEIGHSYSRHRIWLTKEDAEMEGKKSCNYVATAKIEWEE